MKVRGSVAWRTLDSQLALAVDREFEHELLPVLRAFWPSIARVRGLGAYDRAGVDLAALDSSAAIETAVQCKGFFKAEGLEDDQLDPILSSIDKFRRSGLKVGTFVLVHNRDGRNKIVAAKIDAELKKLRDLKIAREVVQWDRHSLLKALAERLRGVVYDRLREQSDYLLNQLAGQFAYGGTYIADVPVRHERLVLARGSPPQILPAEEPGEATRITDAIKKSDAPWTILTGLFGSGKTMSALNAARLYPQDIIYIAAADIRGYFGSSTAAITSLLEALRTFDDYEESDQTLLGRLSSRILRDDLMKADASIALIIDGLDENKNLASPHAIAQFASAMAEFQCPIIMTTRLEHFRSTFGNYDHLFDQLTSKSAHIGGVRLLTLDDWSQKQISAFVQGAVAASPENVALRRLAEDLRNGGSGGWDRELLSHPLFLRMIVDLAAEGGEPLRNRAATMTSWIWSKLIRDLASARPTPVEVKDRNSFIEQMETFMMHIAAEMVGEEEGEMRLLDGLGSKRVIAICENVFATSHIDLGSAISVSLLVPVAVRYRDEVEVRFSHRSFQEYYLARHLHANGADPAGYPDSIHAFWRELY